MITIFLWKICRLFGTFTLDYVYLYDSIKVSLSVVYGGHRVHGLNLEVVCFCDDLFCPKIINGHTKLCHHPIFAQTKIVSTLSCRPLSHLLINSCTKWVGLQLREISRITFPLIFGRNKSLQNQNQNLHFNLIYNYKIL